MNYGASDHSSSFRGELLERGRGDAAGVSITPSFPETTALVHERATSPGCNHRRRKVRRDHAIFCHLKTWRTVPCALPLIPSERMMPP